MGWTHRSALIESCASAVGVTEPAGSDTFVTTTFGGAECVARMRADTDAAPGEVIEFAFNMEKAVFFDPASGIRIG